MFSHCTDRDTSGRIDLQESRGDSKPDKGVFNPVESKHLVDLARRSVGRSEVLEEMALAATVIVHPYVSGTRGLARWSGISDKTLRTIVGPNGKTSEAGFLWTVTRGTSSPIAEERDSMELVYSDSRNDYRSTPSYPSPSSSPEGQEVLDKKILKEGKVSMGNAVVGARIPARAQRVLDKTLEVLAGLNDSNWAVTASGQTLRMLDPGLDIWAEYEGEKPAYVAYEPLGRRAWSLAFLCGLEDVTLAMEDIEALTGLSKRGAQALVKRLMGWPLLVNKVRQGRSFVYEITWANTLSMGGHEFMAVEDRDNVRRERARKDAEVQRTSARRGTPAGYLAWRLSTANKRRDEYLAENPLPDNCIPEWRVLVEEGDEMKLHEWLLAREEAAPKDPGGLVEHMESEDPLTAFVRQQAEARRAQPASKDAEVVQEKLAAMRARIARDSMAARPEPVPAREVGPLDPETAEHWKVSGRDRRMYVTLYGALPAELMV
ncbi:hypothetical protein [Streptomyces apricus]|uniref:hypothetical protein n=1 Tax=Streptomyces apricus TaxID=1828112 RepID=UPI0011F39317|nr:hypothetical protein [Streptomyces apricus]